MKTILITGTSRGIGLELVKQLVRMEEPPDHVIATCRNPEGAQNLQDLAKKYDAIKILKLDVGCFDSFDPLVDKVRDIVGNQALNVLVNNAAILGPFRHNPIVTIEDLTTDVLQDLFLTNTTGPIILTKTLLPLIKEAAANSPIPSFSISRGAIINISSSMGSISLNTSGRYYGYRESKAALNMFSRSLCCELRREKILVTCIHPGWVRTDMGGPDADISVDDSVRGIVQQMNLLREEQNGTFITYEGKYLSL